MIIVFLAAMITVSTPVLAQLERVNTGALTPGATANYRFAEANELSITVTLLGPVGRPGRYEISHTIDLVNLLALAGGWNETADMSDVRISRVKDPTDPGHRVQFLVDLESENDESPSSLELLDGDVVFVGKTTPVTVPLVLSIVGTAATVAMAIGWYTVMNNR